MKDKSQVNDKFFSVGDVAKRSGVSISTLHFYEQRGLISCFRSLGNQRRYKADVLRRISVIKAAQTMGMSLDSIKHALASLPNQRTPNRKDWQRLSEAWREELNKKISTMTRLRDMLDSCIGCGCLSLEICPLYNANDRLSEKGPGPVILQSYKRP